MDVSGQWFDTLIEATRSSAAGIRRDISKSGAPSRLRAKVLRDRRGPHSRLALKLRRLVAEAQNADHQLKGSLHALACTLRTAQVEGLTEVLLEEGPPILNLIIELQSGALYEGDVEAPRAVTFNSRWIRERLESTRPYSGSREAAPSRPVKLTRKEAQVLELLSRGHSNNEMAKHLFISESTVRTHLRSINCKLKAESRARAIVIARNLGLIG